MATKSKILIIGATGYMGKYLVEASVKAGHPTFALIRKASLSSDSSKAAVLDGFKKLGVNFVYGDLSSYENLVSAIKQVDIVISILGGELIADQIKIISAINEAGNIKRFLPSEFDLDVDRIHTIEPLASLYKAKADIRRAIEAQGVPYTYIASHLFAGYCLQNLGDYTCTTPPTHKIHLPGDGNVKGFFVAEEDIAAYAIRGADDLRTLNKILYIRPSENELTSNELVSLWEQKIGKTLQKIYYDEDHVLLKLQDEEIDFAAKLMLAFYYSIFFKGEYTNIEINDSIGLEATQIYPDIHCIPIHHYINRFL